MSRVSDRYRYGQAQTAKPQPYLMDRLSRDPHDPYHSPYFSDEDFRETIRRDLATLLNAKSPADADELEERYPLIATSAMNYGIPPLSGLDVVNIDHKRVIKLVETAIRRFEPRIHRDGMVIRLASNQRREQNEGTCVIRLEIECNVISIAERLVLRTELNLATGVCEVQDESNATVG